MVNKQLTQKFMPKKVVHKVAPIASMYGENMVLPNQSGVTERKHIRVLTTDDLTATSLTATAITTDDLTVKNDATFNNVLSNGNISGQAALFTGTLTCEALTGLKNSDFIIHPNIIDTEATAGNLIFKWLDTLGDTFTESFRIEGAAGDIKVTSDLYFNANGGLPFGQIYAHNVGVGLTSVNVNDWDQIVAFAVNGDFNKTTVDQSTDVIKPLVGGKYLVSWQWSGTGPAASHDWDFHIQSNAGRNDQPQTSAHISTPAAQNLVSTAGSGIIDLREADTVELWVQRLSAGNNIVLTTENCSITITQIGGT